MRRLPTSVWLTLASCVVAGCIWVTPPHDGSSTCSFAGQETACGSCIQQSCLAAVDACCGDTGCAPTLAQLDTCATQGTASACGPLVAARAAYSSDGIAGCVRNACGAACGVGGDAGPAVDAASLLGCGALPLATTPCGTCITSNCGPALATCCGDTTGSCLTHMPSVSACATTQTYDTCLRLSPYNGYAPTAAASLNVCVGHYCAAQCPMVPPQCTTAADCGACCAKAYPKGLKALNDLIASCACSPTTCQSSCASSLFCQADAAQTDQTCETCIQQNQGWGGPCGTSAACYGDLDCEKFTVCAKTCQGP